MNIEDIRKSYLYGVRYNKQTGFSYRGLPGYK